MQCPVLVSPMCPQARHFTSLIDLLSVGQGIRQHALRSLASFDVLFTRYDGLLFLLLLLLLLLSLNTKHDLNDFWRRYTPLSAA